MTDFLPWAQMCTTRIEALLNGEWVDIASEVLQANGRTIDGRLGRQTELDQLVEPSNLTLVLRNNDGRFTPDNLASPLSPHWKTGVQIRWTETIGARSFRFPDMFLEIPETSLTTFTDLDDPSHNDLVVNVACVDLMTRLNRAPRFASNLAAYVKGVGGSTLKAYWPCNEASLPFASVVNSTSNPVLVNDQLTSSLSVPGQLATIEPQAGSMPPGEDLSAARITYLTDGAGSVIQSATLRGSYLYVNPRPQLAAGEVITVVTWIRLDDLNATSGPLVVALNEDSPAGSPLVFVIESGGFWVADVFGGSLSVSAMPDGPGVTAGAPYPIALRYGHTPAVFELWVGPVVTVGTLTGSAPATTELLYVQSSAEFQGTWGHCQVYIGAAEDFTHDDLLAQMAVAENGFANQSVDERIRAITNYAGIPDAQLDLEPSGSVMPTAGFAGQRPGSLASAAATTGGGILFTRESELVYQDRKHRFDL